MKIIRYCPVCDLAMEESPLDPRINMNMLAGVFGPGVFSQIAINDHYQKIEKQLEEHLATHSTLEFVTRIVGLKRELELARGFPLEAPGHE